MTDALANCEAVLDACEQKCAERLAAFREMEAMAQEYEAMVNALRGRMADAVRELKFEDGDGFHIRRAIDILEG